MLKQFGCPVISMTLNMPGAIKRTRLSNYFFERELRALKSVLISLGATVVQEESTHVATGDEALIAVRDFIPEAIKSLAVVIEEHTKASRLLDLDVFREDGTAIDRKSLAMTPRRCLLCEESAVLCAATVRHSSEALQEEVRLLLDGYACNELADIHAGMAMEASSFELMVSPKPGLVTFYEAGSHEDMDRFTFVKSQSVLANYYRASFQTGWKRSLPQTEKAMWLRHEGILAEQAMSEATKGVNTHRGWIYLSGILLNAMGEYWSEFFSGDGVVPVAAQPSSVLQPSFEGAQLSRRSADIARELEQSLSQITHFSYLNERLNAEDSIKGIREEACHGFPSLFDVGYPVLRDSLVMGHDDNTTGLRTLIALLGITSDTTLIRRAGRERASDIREMVRDRLIAGSRGATDETAIVTGALALTENELHEFLDDLCRMFVGKRLSCGGVADLIAGSRLVYRFLFEICH
jgi:holo-ACP synthase/triphosphoribosyl-dephospho-CoA synthase